MCSNLNKLLRILRLRITIVHLAISVFQAPDLIMEMVAIPLSKSVVILIKFVSIIYIASLRI